MDGLMVALLVGLFGGVVNLLVDLPAFWNYDWTNGPPSYRDLVDSPHRYLHTPGFCLLITVPLWVGFVTYINGFGDVRQVFTETDPVVATILNLLYYLFPYIVMVFYGLSTRMSRRVKVWLTMSMSAALLVGVWLSGSFLLLFGYYKDNMPVAIFGYMPPYLALFYSAGTLFCAYILSSKSYSWYNSMLLGSLITYVSSFYWEIPENIYWQFVRGYHPAILLVVLGAFPYIWLDKHLKWKKTRGNLLLILFGWLTTTVGVFITPSNIYTTALGGIYFLFCRIACLLVLVKVFVLDKEGKKVWGGLDVKIH